MIFGALLKSIMLNFWSILASCLVVGMVHEEVSLSSPSGITLIHSLRWCVQLKLTTTTALLPGRNAWGNAIEFHGKKPSQHLMSIIFIRACTAFFSFDPSLWWRMLLSMAAIKDHTRLTASHQASCIMFLCHLTGTRFPLTFYLYQAVMFFVILLRITFLVLYSMYQHLYLGVKLHHKFSWSKTIGFLKFNWHHYPQHLHELAYK